MNPETRFSSHWIVAQQGSGKTHLLSWMVAQDLRRDCSIITMDSKGELTARIRSLALGDRLIVLDPEQPFALNPFDVDKTDIKAAATQIEYVLSALMGASITPMQRSFIRPAIRALITGHKNPTLKTFDDLMYAPKLPQDIRDNIDSDLQRFFDVQWDEYARTRGEIRWRLELVMENDLVKRMFSSPRTKFNIAQKMDEGKVIVIDNAQSKLDEDGCAFLGRFFVSRIWNAATARAGRHPSQKKPVYVYIDEAQLILDPMIAKIIDECRSQKIALILAHQRSSHVTDSNIRGALENCAIKMINVDMGEVAYFSTLLDIPPPRIKDLPRGHFATRVKWEGSSIVEVDHNLNLPRSQTPAEEAALKIRMKEQYGVEPEPPKPAAQPIVEVQAPVPPTPQPSQPSPQQAAKKPKWSRR